MGAGFGHMGEFASLHKQVFGVTPNETLLKKSISRAAGQWIL